MCNEIYSIPTFDCQISLGKENQMNVQRSKPLSDIYNHEETFSEELADHLEELEVGEFEDVETESNVGTRRADIVAVGTDGTLVVENQFDKADWDHWGRLEAYARLNDADVAVLVAEVFEDLMIVTCNLRNEDSAIDWYLIKAQANSYDELSFHHVVRPAIDIPIDRQPIIEYSQFWPPIRNGELGDLFAGAPVRISGERQITKQVHGVVLTLHLLKKRCYIKLSFSGSDRAERRDEIMTLFPESDYKYEYRDSRQYALVIFRVLDKGKNNQDDWPQIREALVEMGTKIYNTIYESDT